MSLMELLKLVRGSEMETSRRLPAGDTATRLGGPRAADRKKEQVSHPEQEDRAFTTLY